MARTRASRARAAKAAPTGPRWADAEPLVLIGTPQALRGELHLDNPTPTRVSLRRGQLLATGADAPGLVPEGAGKEPMRLARVRSVSLRPGERRVVPLSVDLGPHAPPGRYTAQLQVGDLTREATLEVLPRPSLVVTPRRVVVVNRPGETASARVAVRNAGNVPMTIGEIGAVVLDDDVLECRILRRALAEFDPNEDDYTDFLTELVRQAKLTLEEAGLLRVANRSGETTLAPGERAVLDLEVTVPSTADRHARYTGSVALGDTRFGVVVVPATAHPSEGDAT